MNKTSLKKVTFSGENVTFSKPGLELEKLSPRCFSVGEKRVLDYLNKAVTYTGTLKNLAIHTGLTERQLIRIVGKLCSLGLISKESKNGRFGETMISYIFRMDEVEENISESIQSFVSLGRQLKIIKSFQLHKTKNFTSFSNYCNSEWRITKSRAASLIEYYELIEKLKSYNKETACYTLYLKEIHLNLLCKIDRNDLKWAWQILIKTSDVAKTKCFKTTHVKSVLKKLGVDYKPKSALDIIKPSNWWAFGNPKFPTDNGFRGSIPGEVYANALYYFAPEQGVAVDPMAGSGMLRLVYDQRERWQKDRRLNLDVHLFDLHPGPHAEDFGINRHDARSPLPLKADWIFVDPPYFGQSEHLYRGEMAQTKDYKKYLEEIKSIIAAMADSLNHKGRLCLFNTPFIDINSKITVDVPRDQLTICSKIGLKLIERIYVNRGEQQRPHCGKVNLKAKKNVKIFSDTCELHIFEKR